MTTCTYLGLIKSYTTVYKCSCWTKCKTHLPFEYTQSLTTVVKMVGTCRRVDQKMKYGLTSKPALNLVVL